MAQNTTSNRGYDDTVYIPRQQRPSLCGADVRTYPLYRENGFLPKLSDIPEETAKAAKYMLVSYPLNPVCATANDAFYDSLVQIYKKRIRGLS